MRDLGIVADRTTNTSDYFEELQNIMIKLIETGYAFADNTSQEQMRDERGKGIASKNRDMSAEETVSIFKSLLKGEKKD